jgi:hypothetical protein
VRRYVQSTYSSRKPEKKMVKPSVRRFTTRLVTMHAKPFSLKYVYRLVNHWSRFWMRRLVPTSLSVA